MVTPSHHHGRTLVAALANVAIWAFLTLLVASQFLGVLWDSTTVRQPLFFGRSPLGNGPASIAGTNDEPYSDRNLVCLAHGRSFVPTQLSVVLENTRLSHLVDTTGTSISGYRVIKRATTASLDPLAYQFYMEVCSNIDQTLEAIQDNCEKMGYNVTRDVLRIVPDIDSKETKEIPKALPVLIMPFWDSARRAHYAIPGWDGMACTFRLYGLFTNLEIPDAAMRGVGRDVRASKTVEWLNKPGGEWRNGWYEDGTGQRWNAEMDTSELGNIYGLTARVFDAVANTEYDCSATPAPAACSEYATYESWGVTSTVTTAALRVNQVFISNGTHFGQFMFRSENLRTIQNKYTLETFLSNMSISLLCLRWFVSMAAMFNSYRRGLSPIRATGIGCFANSRAFILLPVILLPRLKIILAVFWTVGCDFQGQQIAMSEAWFAMYPAIVEFVLVYFSGLNVASKLAFRRTSDALVGPTLVVLALLHYYRSNLANSSWLGVDGRVVTRVSSSEFDALYWYELLKPSMALRLNGNVKPLIHIKLVILGINCLPLLWSKNMSRSGATYRSHGACQIEQWLALRASNVGGLGVSRVYAAHENPPPSRKRDSLTGSSEQLSVATRLNVRPATVVVDGSSCPPRGPPRHVLLGYEVSRLGYIVYGDKYLISYEDWYVLTTMAPLRIVEKLWNHRITVFDVVMDPSKGLCEVTGPSRLCRLDDDHLSKVPWYCVTLCSVR